MNLTSLALTYHQQVKWLESDRQRWRTLAIVVTIIALLFGLAAATKADTLAWDPPTANTDGTPLTTLSFYRVFQGTSSGVYATNWNVGLATTAAVTYMGATADAWVPASITDTCGSNIVISGSRFMPGAYPTNYFTVRCQNTNFVESDYSPELAVAPPAATGITYEVRLGATAGTLTTVIACGTNTTVAIARSALPYKLLVYRWCAMRGTNTLAVHPYLGSVPNTKSSVPTGLRML